MLRRSFLARLLKLPRARPTRYYLHAREELAMDPPGEVSPPDGYRGARLAGCK